VRDAPDRHGVAFGCAQVAAMHSVGSHEARAPRHSNTASQGSGFGWVLGRYCIIAGWFVSKLLQQQSGSDRVCGSSMRFRSSAPVP
jgi:hypothetical protein